MQLPLPLPDPIIFLSASKLADDGVFLLENGFEAYIHFGDRVEPDFLLSVIGEKILVAVHTVPLSATLPWYVTFRPNNASKPLAQTTFLQVLAVKLATLSCSLLHPLSFIHALEFCISAKPPGRSVMQHTAQHESAIAWSKLWPASCRTP